MLQKQAHQDCAIVCVFGKLGVWPRVVDEDFRKATVRKFGNRRCVANTAMLELKYFTAPPVRQALPHRGLRRLFDLGMRVGLFFEG